MLLGPLFFQRKLSRLILHACKIITACMYACMYCKLPSKHTYKYTDNIKQCGWTTRQCTYSCPY